MCYDRALFWRLLHFYLECTSSCHRLHREGLHHPCVMYHQVSRFISSRVKDIHSCCVRGSTQQPREHSGILTLGLFVGQSFDSARISLGSWVREWFLIFRVNHSPDGVGHFSLDAAVRVGDKRQWTLLNLDSSNGLISTPSRSHSIRKKFTELSHFKKINPLRIPKQSGVDCGRYVADFGLALQDHSVCPNLRMVFLFRCFFRCWVVAISITSKRSRPLFRSISRQSRKKTQPHDFWSWWVCKNRILWWDIRSYRNEQYLVVINNICCNASSLTIKTPGQRWGVMRFYYYLIYNKLWSINHPLPPTHPIYFQSCHYLVATKAWRRNSLSLCRLAKGI